MTITQGDVDDKFAMLVPVFADFGSGLVRIGQVAIAGNTTRTSEAMLPAKPRSDVLNAYREVLER
jgi:hypothetical protein